MLGFPFLEVDTFTLFQRTGFEVRKATEKIRMCLISPDCGFLFIVCGPSTGPGT